MTTFPLSCGSKIFIEQFSDAMNIEDSDYIKECVYKYTQPSSSAPLVERLRYVWFRFTNAIKAIFGRSEWQITEKKIGDNKIGSLFLKFSLSFNQKNRHDCPVSFTKFFDAMKKPPTSDFKFTAEMLKEDQMKSTQCTPSCFHPV